MYHFLVITMTEVEEKNLFEGPAILQVIEEKRDEIAKELEKIEPVNKLNQYRLDFYRALFGEKASAKEAQKRLRIYLNELRIAPEKYPNSSYVKDFVEVENNKLEKYLKKTETLYQREKDQAEYTEASLKYQDERLKKSIESLKETKAKIEELEKEITSKK